MNNEVLRRKMFRTILADSRAPKGILASSPEMVETVQRRANGGINTGGLGSQTVSDYFNTRRGAPNRRTLSGAGMPEGTQSYLELLEQIKDLPIKQQGEILRRAGYGASIGPDVAGYVGDRVGQFSDLYTGAVSDLDAIKAGIGSIFEPKEGTGLYTLEPLEDGRLGFGPPRELSKGEVLARTPQADAMSQVEADMSSAARPDDYSILQMPSVRSALEPDAKEKTEEASGSTTVVKPDMQRAIRSAEQPDDYSILQMPSVRSALEPDAKEKTEEASGSTTGEEKSETKVIEPEDLVTNITTALEDENKSTKQKADAIDEALDIKGTRKERTAQRYEYLKELLGEDKAKDIRTDANYNLIMTGLMIAAGQSPDALTNIATGLAKGLKGYGEASGEAAKEENKRERAMKLMAAKEIGEEITAETAADIRAQELADQRAFQAEQPAAKLQASREIAELPGETQRLLQAIADQTGMSMSEVYMLNKAGKDTDTQRLASNYFKVFGPKGLTVEEAGILANAKIADDETVQDAIKRLFGKDFSADSKTTKSGFSKATKIK